MTAPPPCPQPQSFPVITGFLTPGSDAGPGTLDASISVDVLDPTEGNERVRAVEITDHWRLEVDWWLAHRENQYSTEPRGAGDELVESVTRLYGYLYREPEQEVRAAAVHRARAMDLSDQWVAEGCDPDSPLLPLEHAALVRSYAALLAAVHH